MTFILLILHDFSIRYGMAMYICMLMSTIELVACGKGLLTAYYVV
jgi:hypothetical protein